MRFHNERSWLLRIERWRYVQTVGALDAIDREAGMLNPASDRADLRRRGRATTRRHANGEENAHKQHETTPLQRQGDQLTTSRCASMTLPGVSPSIVT